MESLSKCFCSLTFLTLYWDSWQKGLCFAILLWLQCHVGWINLFAHIHMFNSTFSEADALICNVWIHLFDVFGYKGSCNVLVWSFRIRTCWRDPTDAPEARGPQEQVMCQSNTTRAEPVQRHGLWIRKTERTKRVIRNP